MLSNKQYHRLKLNGYDVTCWLWRHLLAVRVLKLSEKYFKSVNPLMGKLYAYSISFCIVRHENLMFCPYIMSKSSLEGVEIK